jgi:hypothetical protein
MSSKNKFKEVHKSNAQVEAELTAKAAHATLVGDTQNKGGSKATKKAPPAKKANKGKGKAAKPATKSKASKTISKPKKAKGKAAVKKRAEKREAEVSKMASPAVKNISKDPEDWDYEVTFKSGNRWQSAGKYKGLKAGMQRFSRLKRSLYRNEMVCIQNRDTHRAAACYGELTTTAEDLKAGEDLQSKGNFPPVVKSSNGKGSAKTKKTTTYKKGTQDHPSVDELFGSEYRETETDYGQSQDPDYKGADTD